MLIRCAKDTDFPKIKEIFNRPELASSANEWTVAEQEDADDAFEQTGTHFVVQEDDRLIGYAGYRRRPENEAVIQHEMVLGACADNENSAYTLLAALMEHARVRGFRRMVASIGRGNAASIAVHERLGFARTPASIPAVKGSRGSLSMILDL